MIRVTNHKPVLARVGSCAVRTESISGMQVYQHISSGADILASEESSSALPESIVSTWQKIVNAAANSLGTPCVMINRITPPELEVFRSSTVSEHMFPAGAHFPMAGLYCTHVASEKQYLSVPNALKDSRWADSLTAKVGVIAYTGYPLLWPDGRVFGTLCTVDTKENSWGPQHEELLFTFKLSIEAHLAMYRSHEELTAKNRELMAALDEVKVLQGLLPICTSCKKIRDDNGYWMKLEAYFSSRTSIEFSHGICPDCAGLLYPEYHLYSDHQPVA